MDFKFKSLDEFLKTFHNDQKCIDFLEKIRWEGNFISPFDLPHPLYYKECTNLG